MRSTSASVAVVALAAVMALGSGSAQADPHGGYRGGGYHGGHGYYGGGRGWGWGGVGIGLGLGIGIGALASPYYGPYYGYYDYPGYVVVQQPPVVSYSVPVATAPAAPTAQGAADPVIYPRSGQSANQTEADRQECNRWATTVPSAMADASVFQRAIAACMDARGYTLK